MSSKLNVSRYRPKSRDYTFEAIIYCLEKGPAGMLLINLMVTYILYTLNQDLIMIHQFYNNIRINTINNRSIILGIMIYKSWAESKAKWESSK